MSVVVPLLIPWFAGAAFALLDGRRRWVGWAAVGALAATFAATCALIALVGNEDGSTVAGDWPAGIGIELRADALGVLFAVISNGVLLSALVFEVARGVRSRLFPSLVLFLSAGMTGLFLTADIFNFYVFFELAMIAAYALAVYGDEARQLRAGFIFAIVNLLGSFLFLIGIAAIYHVTGTLEMTTAAERIAAVEPSAVILIAIAIFVAFGVKLGLFPFHFWLPTVYASATPGVAAMLSGAVANIGSYGILRFGPGILPAAVELGATVLIAIGTLSIIYGALQAISRRSSQEVLAYSAIGQAGYVLIAIGLGGPAGLTAAIVYAVVNSLNKALLFLATGVRGFLIGAAFAVGAFSVAGVPPSAGFFGKVELFRAGVVEDSVALVALIFLGGALSFVYMFQIYQHEFWGPSRRSGAESPAAVRAVAVALAAIVIAVGLWPEPLLAASREAAAVLGGGG
ncbi:MAG: proton-conducting transporter membrane subunit [Solirubrobacterales bacterium]